MSPFTRPRESVTTGNSSTSGAVSVPAKNTANPATPNGPNSVTTSASAKSPSAPATGPTAPPASMNTPAFAARCCDLTSPRSPACCKLSITLLNVLKKPARCSGSAKSPPWKKASGTSRERKTRLTASNARPDKTRSVLKDSLRFPRSGAAVPEPQSAAAVTALAGGQLPCSGAERRLLRLAASLGDGIPVDLRDALASLDDANLDLVTTAVRHAAGRRPGT